MKLDDAKTLYQHYYAEKYRDFTRSDAIEFSLPSIPKLSFISATSEKNPRMDVFEKIAVEGSEDDKVRLVHKNKAPHAILWKTEAEKLKQAVRWGIVKTESITGQVISTLGHYRTTAHERIAKGMVSDTQGLKMALLDIYQSRFEALEALESLVNKQNTLLSYTNAIRKYQRNLSSLRGEIKARFEKVLLPQMGDEGLPGKIIADITEDMNNANDYLVKLAANREELIPAANRAKGNDSILEFVKQQMHKSLYEMQGLNQDLVFSRGALTRGELNDYIEDARKLIDDHRPDLRNAVTAKHHGDYQDEKDTENKVTYDFSLDDLDPDQERKVLSAISFIEGWDRVDYADQNNDNLPTVYNKNNEAGSLRTVIATKWNAHQSYLRYLWEYSKTWFRGFIFETHPWDEQGEIALYASTLKKYARPNEPLWKKLGNYLYGWGLEFKNIFTGVYHSGKKIILGLPEEVVNDWLSTKALPDLRQTLIAATAEIDIIQDEENSRLATLVTVDERAEIEKKIGKNKSLFAQAEYHLDHYEDGDILTAATKGLYAFTSHITHDIYNKDPLGGVFYTTAASTVLVCLVYPAFAKSIFLVPYVNFIDSATELVGASLSSKVLCGGAMQAQAAFLVWNAATDGPSCGLSHAAEKFLDNPVPVSLGFAAAYGLGYVFANAPIPHFHEFIKDEMGSSDLLNYPVVGVKLGLTAFMAFQAGERKAYHPLEIVFHGNELQEENKKNKDNNKKIDQRKCDQYRIAAWLNDNVSMLRKLNTKTRSDIRRHLDLLFSKEEAESLKKMLAPESERSIAYQLLAIPFAYIPGILRCLIALGMSLLAVLAGSTHWKQPVIEAGTALFRKTAKDLSRIIVASSNLLYIVTNLVGSQLKAFTYTGAMLIARFAAFFDYHPGHAMHKAFAGIHSLYRKIGEFLYPARVLKSVGYADPVHTVNQVVGTYTKCMNKLGIESSDRSFAEDKLLRQSSFRIKTKNRDERVAELFEEFEASNKESVASHGENDHLRFGT